MKIKSMPLGPLGTNCFILYKEQEALIVDPGGDASQVVSFLNREQLRPKAILLTHAHFDHIGAVEELRNYYQLDVYLHELEKEWLTDPTLNGSRSFIGEEISTNGPDKFFEPGTLSIAKFSCEILHTPGHSPGSVSIVFEEDSLVVSGDALFHSGIGRTDLPGGDFKQLEDSIKQQLYSLPDHFEVYPGHGPQTSIGAEKRHNPFIKA
ncbi:MBL fold metallo-hydrolase [Ornithinibacillus sp. L9]|uniref:MBL fold metallo-hydrolase n=1 Tax=Ornithinibacillus caprae TaxID=2678566 RepID=A0A6N8FC50_9BACI|nr:MBL fold metallo-hydrolase [Ornithinibacillus caprae]MUK87130.1 MBL fold metallo-hydrolase [Ornithinibacillus caprae]